LSNYPNHKLKGIKFVRFLIIFKLKSTVAHSLNDAVHTLTLTIKIYLYYNI